MSILNDTWENVTDNIRYGLWKQDLADFVDLGREGVEIVDQFFKEGAEILTDGVVEMVVKDNNDYKTSYELVDEAKATIAKATARYEKQRNKTEQNKECVERQLNSYSELCEATFTAALSAWRQIAAQNSDPTVKAIVDRLSAQYPAYDFSFGKGPGRAAVDLSAVAGLRPEPTCRAPVWSLDDFRPYLMVICPPLPRGPGKQARVKAAKRFHQEALDYGAEAKLVRTQLKHVRALLQGLCHRIDENRLVLGKLQQAMTGLEESRKRSELDLELATLIMGAVAAICLHPLLADDGSVRPCVGLRQDLDKLQTILTNRRQNAESASDRIGMT